MAAASRAGLACFAVALAVGFLLDYVSRHPGRMRQVVDVGPDVDDVSLQAMHGAGACGIRVDLADHLAEWIPDGPTCRRVLVDNPAALYGL